MPIIGVQPVTAMTTPSNIVGSQCKVLLAEDTPSNAILAMEVLSQANCHAVLVTDGEQAVSACQEEDFNLILMDVHMPAMTGIEAAAAIREWERQTGTKRHRIVGLTASAMPHEVELCIQAGMDQVLVKPVSIVELRCIVLQVCAMRHVS